MWAKPSPTLLKSLSPLPGVCEAAGGTSSKVERGQRSYLVVLLHPWKVDGKTSWVCSPRAQPFGLCGPQRCRSASSKAFGGDMGLNATPRGEGSPACGQAGRGSFPCPGEVGLKDGGAEGWGRKKDGVAHMQPPAYRGQFLICSDPSPKKVTVKGSVWPSRQKQPVLGSSSLQGRPQTHIPLVAPPRGHLQAEKTLTTA